MTKYCQLVERKFAKNVIINYLLSKNQAVKNVANNCKIKRKNIAVTAEQNHIYIREELDCLKTEASVRSESMQLSIRIKESMSISIQMRLQNDMAEKVITGKQI